MADEKALKTVATVVYALQGLGVVLPLVLPWIVAVIIDYVKKEDAAGTWLESHFRWQIRTFWWSVLWLLIGGILAFIVVGFAVLAATLIWMIYRIVKGWLRLSEHREVS
jgi:uncharacterized membrane protein